MATYQRLPTSATAADENEEEELSRTNAYTRSTLAEFNREPPAWWKRGLVLFAIFFLGFAAWKISKIGEHNKPKIIYATRYSEEFKYRPAASPVITEYLKDGRIRLRGASPGGVGVKPGDIPLTPAQKAAEERAKRKEAAQKAKEQLKERRKRRKEEKLEKKRRTAQAEYRAHRGDP